MLLLREPVRRRQDVAARNRRAAAGSTQRGLVQHERVEAALAARDRGRPRRGPGSRGGLGVAGRAARRREQQAERAAIQEAERAVTGVQEQGTVPDAPNAVGERGGRGRGSRGGIRGGRGRGMRIQELEGGAAFINFSIN